METLLDNATEILLLLFLIITFLQSGADKIFDWNNNLVWLKGHFAATIFKNSVPALLMIVLVAEMAAGILCLVGLCQLLVTGDRDMAFYGAIVSCISLLILLLGQRVAKDYEGAKTIVIYLMPAVFLVFLLQA